MSFIVETDRLGMRPYDPDDAEEFFALFSDPKVMRYIVGEATPGSVDEMRRMLADYPDYDKHGFGRWSCIHKESGRFIGFSGLKYLEDFDSLNVSRSCDLIASGRCYHRRSFWISRPSPS